MNKKQKDQLVELVKKEAKALRTKATTSERAKLNFDDLQVASSKNCIYGQMTGSCLTSRAHDLIATCAERVYRRGKLNGEPTVKKLERNRAEFEFTVFSPIERFIMFNAGENDNNEILINYLKGKTKTLKFQSF